MKNSKNILYKARYIKSCFCLLNCKSPLFFQFTLNITMAEHLSSCVRWAFVFLILPLPVCYPFENLVTDVFPLVTCYRNLLSYLFQIFTHCQFVICLVIWSNVCVYVYVFNHKKFYIFMWSSLVIFSKCYGSWIWIMFNQGFHITKLKYSSKFSFVAFMIFFFTFYSFIFLDFILV